MFLRVISPISIEDEKFEIEASVAENVRRWHEGLGHVNVDKITHLAKNEIVTGLRSFQARKFDCHGCFRPNLNRTKYEIGEFFHSHLCGLIFPSSLGGSRYVLVFVDVESGYKHNLLYQTQIRCLLSFYGIRQPDRDKVWQKNERTLYG